MNSVVDPGVLQAIPSAGVVPAATPGPMGSNDAHDPAHAVVDQAAGPGPAGHAATSPPGTGRPSTVAGAVHAAACFGTQSLPQGLRLDQDAFVDAYKRVRHEAVFASLTSQERVDNLKRFLNSMAADATIDTVFKASYILATAIHEGRSADTAWQMTWDPVSESSGNGAPYWSAVYVRDLQHRPLDENGELIDPLPPTKDAKGKIHQQPHPGAITDANLPRHYPKDKLIKRIFNGRGYVQLTWLENYVSLGETIGIGKKLAADPELALDHDTAYKIASVGMIQGCFMGRRTYTEGQGRTGGHKLADYTDYVKARAIINGGGDRAEDIARYARIFEQLIQDSRLA